MHGLWRAGGTGIAPGYGFDPTGAWARYDNVVADCPGPCAVSLRMASVAGTRVRFALGTPTGAKIVDASIGADTSLREHVLMLKGSINVTGESLFLPLDGDCSVDYFRFSTQQR